MRQNKEMTRMIDLRFVMLQARGSFIDSDQPFGLE
jgi:hypothetical protein